ncbi:MAG: hypothetical protein ACXVCV_07220 [Polyangia bacterium]
MKRILVATVCSAIGLGLGCASPTEIRQGAYGHLARAQALEAQGDYYHASKERAAANKQFAKANERAYDEAAAGYYRF